MVSEEEKVRQSVQSFYEAFNSHLFESAAQFTTEDWTHVNPLGGRTSGRQSVLKELKDVHSTFLKGITDTVMEMSVRFASSEVAVVIVPSILSGRFTTPDGVIHENDRQIRTFVVLKRDDKWLIMHDHNTFAIL